MAESSSSSSAAAAKSSLNDQLDGPVRSPRRNRGGRNNDLDSMPSRRDENGKPIPAWKLREQMKSQKHVSSHPSRSIRPVSRTPGSLGANRSSMKNGGALDPSLPPAFRSAFARQQARKHNKDIDDFMSLDSVHSGKSGTNMTGTPTTNNDSDGSIGSDSFDGHDSFASLGEDSDDDEAYRESKNLLARQELEGQRKTSGNKARGGSDYRFKKTGVHGTPLDFIAE